MTWYEVKLLVAEATSLDMDALHVVVGLAAFLAFARLLARPLADPLPWLAVLWIELANEAIDLGAERWPDVAAQLAESAKDVWLTMLVPTVILALQDRLPRLLAVRSRDRG